MNGKQALNDLETSERKPSKGGVKIGSFCKDCLHYEACKAMDEEVDLTHLGLAKVCPHFKPQSRFVEVVRCKDCENWKRNIGYVDSPNGHCFYHCEDTNQFDFCSCGEKALKEREKE